MKKPVSHQAGPVFSFPSNLSPLVILRLDELVLDLPKPTNPSANDAAAVQELLGGKFGEMSTLINYTFQSFNFRGRDRLRPFYSLTAAIAAEEYSHTKAVSYAINLLLTGTSKHDPDPVTGPLAGAVDSRNTHHFIASGQAALPMDPMGRLLDRRQRVQLRQPAP